MKKIFNFTELAYHLRSNNRLERHTTKSPNDGNETISHLTRKIWKLFPEESEEIDSLSI